MMSYSTQRLVVVLKSEPVRSLKLLEALREANAHTIGEAIRECIYVRETAVVNRTRALALIDMLVQRSTQAPVMELAQPGKEVA